MLLPIAIVFTYAIVGIVKTKKLRRMSNDQPNRRISTTISVYNWELLMAAMKKLGYKGTPDSLVRELAIDSIKKKIESGEIPINSDILKLQGVNTWSGLIIKFLDLLTTSEFFKGSSRSINNETLDAMVRGSLPSDLTPDCSKLTTEDMISEIKELHTYVTILQVACALNYAGYSINLDYMQKCIELQLTDDNQIG